MYEYKFKRVNLHHGFFERKPTEDYHKIVHEHAEDGWRLVHILFPGGEGRSDARYFELIFERAK